jgi:hypothetical protein
MQFADAGGDHDALGIAPRSFADAILGIDRRRGAGRRRAEVGAPGAAARPGRGGQALALGIGPRSGNARNYSLDFSYSFSDQWQGTAWFSRNETQQELSQHVGAGTAGLVWAALLRNTGDSLGLGLKGKPFSWLELGADLSHSDIADTYDQQRLNAVAPGTVVATLPEITTRNTRLQLFAKYAVKKNSDVRIDYIIDRFSTNDWTWSTWTFSDGTRMLQDPVQKVNFLGISYQYRWQ